MKQILLAYLFFSLLIVALISVLSFGYGAGYVYIYWREWQVQTNIWFFLILLAVLSLVGQLIWLGLKRYLSREQRKRENVFSFNQLHPYEQLAVIWTLNAAQDQREFIQQAFSESGLLKGIMDARLYWMRAEYDQALNALNDTSPMAFELAEVQRIEVYLSQQDGEKALTHLEFLNQHELSPWLQNVSTAYEQRLTALWGQFALQFPWMYLRSTKYGHLDESMKQAWLEQLLAAFDQADSDELQLLKERYDALHDQIFERTFHIKVLWLKVLARMPEMSEQHEQLAVHLLSVQFSQEVFYLWFQQQLLKQNPEYALIEERINTWENQYPALPVFSFAKWHVYHATGRQAEADLLLKQYPDDVLMSYLRIKTNLSDQEDLIKQLNLIFENNANFVEIKI